MVYGLVSKQVFRPSNLNVEDERIHFPWDAVRRHGQSHFWLVVRINLYPLNIRYLNINVSNYSFKHQSIPSAFSRNNLLYPNTLDGLFTIFLARSAPRYRMDGSSQTKLGSRAGDKPISSVMQSPQGLNHIRWRAILSLFSPS
jgi:hypothetical protein